MNETVRDLLTRNRSFRRFDENRRLDRSMLVELVELSRLCPSGGNRQPLRFMIASRPEETACVFPCLRWAALLKDWGGPTPGQRPAAYVLILRDPRVGGTVELDAGIVAQSLLLGAVERGLGGCLVGSIDRDQLRTAMRVPGELEIVLVVALGHPAETVVLEEAKGADDIGYWRDASGVHHVPKRPMAQLLIEP
ncbi:MAG: nitroreductase family protein [Planctomycetaceae bacterium]|nr:nitroreductase family protein [Planctomycetaceae bacterium]